jgi:hypothetical protein
MPTVFALFQSLLGQPQVVVAARNTQLSETGVVEVYRNIQIYKAIEKLQANVNQKSFPPSFVKALNKYKEIKPTRVLDLEYRSGYDISQTTSAFTEALLDALSTSLKELEKSCKRGNKTYLQGCRTLASKKNFNVTQFTNAWQTAKKKTSVADDCVETYIHALWEMQTISICNAFSSVLGTNVETPNVSSSLALNPTEKQSLWEAIKSSSAAKWITRWFPFPSQTTVDVSSVSPTAVFPLEQEQEKEKELEPESILQPHAQTRLLVQDSSLSSSSSSSARQICATYFVPKGKQITFKEHFLNSCKKHGYSTTQTMPTGICKIINETDCSIHTKNITGKAPEKIIAELKNYLKNSNSVKKTIKCSSDDIPLALFWIGILGKAPPDVYQKALALNKYPAETPIGVRESIQAVSIQKTQDLATHLQRHSLLGILKAAERKGVEDNRDLRSVFNEKNNTLLNEWKVWGILNSRQMKTLREDISQCNHGQIKNAIKNSKPLEVLLFNVARRNVDDFGDFGEISMDFIDKLNLESMTDGQLKKLAKKMNSVISTNIDPLLKGDTLIVKRVIDGANVALSVREVFSKKMTGWYPCACRTLAENIDYEGSNNAQLRQFDELYFAVIGWVKTEELRVARAFLKAFPATKTVEKKTQINSNDSENDVDNSKKNLKEDVPVIFKSAPPSSLDNFGEKTSKKWFVQFWGVSKEWVVCLWETFFKRETQEDLPVFSPTSTITSSTPRRSSSPSVQPQTQESLDKVITDPSQNEQLKIEEVDPSLQENLLRFNIVESATTNTLKIPTLLKEFVEIGRKNKIVYTKTGDGRTPFEQKINNLYRVTPKDILVKANELLENNGDNITSFVGAKHLYCCAKACRTGNNTAQFYNTLKACAIGIMYDIEGRVIDLSSSNTEDCKRLLDWLLVKKEKQDLVALIPKTKQAVSTPSHSNLSNTLSLDSPPLRYLLSSSGKMKNAIHQNLHARLDASRLWNEPGLLGKLQNQFQKSLAFAVKRCLKSFRGQIPIITIDDKPVDMQYIFSHQCSEHYREACNNMMNIKGLDKQLFGDICFYAACLTKAQALEILIAFKDQYPSIVKARPKKKK